MRISISFLFTIAGLIHTSQPAYSDEVRMTRVRVLEEPRVVWGGSSSGTYANSAQAIVRNVGRAKAKKVRVELILPGGAIAVLKGPAFLMPNQKAVYTWKSKELVVGIGRVIPKTDCENCYR